MTSEKYKAELINDIVAPLSNLHWGSGCGKCQLSEYCKDNEDCECQEVWRKWLKEQLIDS